MSGENLFLFSLLSVAILLFISNRVRLDVVAILVILALMLSGLLSPKQALAGFGDPVVILIAGLFVVGEGLFRTGIAHSVGKWLTHAAGESETRLLVLLMLVVAVLSAFMSSTGAVAVFIPVVLSLTHRAGISPSQLLMPMAFASLIGGMLTLIGTPPNLVVSIQLEREAFEPFGFFSFTPIGLIALGCGIGYMLVIGKRFLPDPSVNNQPRHDKPSLADFIELYDLVDQFRCFQIVAGSSLIGLSLLQAALRSRYGFTVVGIERRQPMKTSMIPAQPHTRMDIGDYLYGLASDKRTLEKIPNTDLQTIFMTQKQKNIIAKDLGLAEIILPPRSALVGRSLKESRFRDHYGGSVLGILRKGKPIVDDLIHTQLYFGDTLLIGGHWDQIRLLQEERSNFIVLDLPAEIQQVAPARQKAPLALFILLCMLLLMASKWVPSVAAVLIAAVAMVLTGCVRMKDAYSAINWESLVLIAGMLPMAEALEQSGGINLIVDGFVASLGEFGPYAVLTGLFILTSLFSQFISNTATTVLVAPIAVNIAAQLHLSPYPLLMTVAISASTAFATPVASPVNTLVLSPGGYGFADFAKVGIPLQAAIMVITLSVVTLFFPL
jgi:di/tricarboxylate transporter